MAKIPAPGRQDVNLKRFNDGLARGEAALAVAMLLLMIVVAFAQAALRNLTNLGVGWANAGLAWLHWADFVLSKGTLWLAFLGASLAVHNDKHVAIDILPRFVSPRARLVMRACVGVIGSVICFYLARAFWSAILINGEERPPAYEIITPEGGAHVCDATAQQLASEAIETGVFCYVRGFFKLLGATLETPGSVFQLVVPVSFVFMSVRMLGTGISDFVRVVHGQTFDDLSPHGFESNAKDVAGDIAAADKKDRRP